MIRTVWTVLITHEHGHNLWLYPSEEEASQALYGYVVTWWEDLAAFDGPDTVPEDHEEAIETYFDIMRYVERPEDYELSQHNVEFKK